MDVDRRYFNDHSGPTGYATIDLQPGYQRLSGLRALDFVRYRHTDSDFYRNARQQQFVRALKDQVESSFSLLRLPQVIKVITSNVEAGQGGGKDVSPEDGALSTPRWPTPCRAGHIFQARLEGLEGFGDLTTAPENVQRAVAEFANPDVESPKKATAAALGEKVKQKAPPANQTTVTVLNGNGVTGSASSANYLLTQRGYEMVLPPNGIPANAPSFEFFRTVVFFDPAKRGAKPAATKLAGLFGTADVKRITVPVRQLANGAMLAAVVGQTFHGRLAPAPIDKTPARQPPQIVPGTGASLDLLRQAQRGDAVPAHGAHRRRAVVLDRLGAAAPLLLLRSEAQAQQDDPAHVQARRAERVLGRAAERLGRRAGAEREERDADGSRGGATSSTTRARTCTWSSCAPRAARTGS